MNVSRCTLTALCTALSILPAESLSQQKAGERPLPSLRSRLVPGTSDVEASWEECTIGVASGRATPDGRPMIWKTRDTDQYHNAVYWNRWSRYKYLTVIDGGSRSSSWMGVNEKGFAILNSLAYDLVVGSTGLGNGSLMTYALSNCRTVDEFRHLLDSTNATGRQTRSNFAVMDTTGAASIFETSGSSYWEFNAADSIACPDGYLLRTNFTMTGGGDQGMIRYLRTAALFAAFSAGDSITPRSILRYQMRDFADESGNPYSIPFHGTVDAAPYGYIPFADAICRVSSASAAVVQGVRATEAATTSTFWVILGCPATGVALPYWPVGTNPFPSVDQPTAELNDVANEIFDKMWGGPTWPSYLNTMVLRNDDGHGVFPDLFAAEDIVYAAADTLVSGWRAGAHSVSTVLRAESLYAALTLDAMKSARDKITGVNDHSLVGLPAEYVLHQSYPNPFNPSTTIGWRMKEGGFVKVSVTDLLGREIAVLVNQEQSPGEHRIIWNAQGMATGMYFCRLEATGADRKTFVQTRKMVLAR